jgi:hypothetical protein
MKPKQKAVTDAELLVLLEGDVSDVDLEISDEADIEIDEHQCTSHTIPGPDPGKIEAQDEEEMEVNDVPLAPHLQTSCGGDTTVPDICNESR